VYGVTATTSSKSPISGKDNDAQDKNKNNGPDWTQALKSHLVIEEIDS
jgi:hypothetical protein